MISGVRGYCKWILSRVYSWMAGTGNILRQFDGYYQEHTCWEQVYKFLWVISLLLHVSVRVWVLAMTARVASAVLHHKDLQVIN